ncbi:MAG: hypothetical protein NTV58_00760 [Deltaproteobacteria bacterium]|nr:hypothetical protein [Deltaproteobacteria bacterium]
MHNIVFHLRSSLFSRILALSGFLFVIAVFYPGFLSSDSMEQYQQAKLGVLSDAHPIAMSLLWRGLIYIHDGPLLMLVLQSALLWTGLYLLTRVYMTRWRGIYPLLFLVVGITPNMLIYAGVIWKDVQMAHSYLAATALFVWILNADQPARKAVRCAAFLAGLLLFYGSLVRHNAIAAAIPMVPLFACALSRCWDGVCNLVSRRTMYLSIILFILLLGAQPLLNVVVKPQRDHFVQYIQLYDLAGISLRIDKPLFPDWIINDKARFNMQSVKHFYNPYSGNYLFYDHYGLDYPAPLTMTRDPGRLAELNSVWINSVLAYWPQWIDHKLDCFLALLRYSDWSWNSVAGVLVIQENHQSRRPFYSVATISYLILFSGTYLFRPWIWIYIIIAGLIVALMGIKRIPQSRQQFAICFTLFLSALLYIAGYALISSADDFRYVYWSTFATIIGWIILIGEAKEIAGIEQKT